MPMANLGWIRCYQISKNPDIVKLILEILYSVFTRSHITLLVRAKKLKFILEINGRVDRQTLANFKLIFDLFISFSNKNINYIVLLL